jgi:hypothetical protein
MAKAWASAEGCLWLTVIGYQNQAAPHESRRSRALLITIARRLFSSGSCSLLAAIVLSTGLVFGVSSVDAASPATDKESLWTQHCLAWERITTPNVACVYGDKTSTVVVALVGDSHASHLFPAVEKIAKARHWKVVVMVKVSCGFVDMRIRNIALGREYTECAVWNRNVVKRLTVLKPALTLVAMSRQALHEVRSVDASNLAKGLAVGRMIKKVPGQVAIIIDSPLARINVPVCIATRGAARCAIPKSTGMSQGLGAIEKTARASSDARLIDLTSATCATWPCPVVVKGITVFRDSEHFTATFSRSVLGTSGGTLDMALEASLP